MARKGKKRIGLIIVILLVVAIVTCMLITVIGNSALMKKAKSFVAAEYTAQKAPEKDADGWVFSCDGDFKVLQLTDVHLGGGFLSQKKDAMALNCVAAMITAEKPDLVIVTGDIAYPVPFQAGTFNNMYGAKLFSNLMETLGVYWTFAFGNHDTEAYSYYDREDICKYYEEAGFQYCLFTAGPDVVDGFGNQLIKVKNNQGIITQAFFVLDSHAYVDGDILGIQWKYDNIHQNQVDWYAQKVGEMNAANKAALATADVSLLPAGADFTTVKSLLFFHIPLVEYLDAWTEYLENDSQDTANVQYIYGKLGETGKLIYCGIGEDNLFEKILELESTQGIFCGHDHYNNFSIEYKGVRLTYGMSTDYLAYAGVSKKGSQRGCTLITVNNKGEFSCENSNYYQDKYVSQYEKETVTMQWED